MNSNDKSSNSQTKSKQVNVTTQYVLLEDFADGPSHVSVCDTFDDVEHCFRVYGMLERPAEKGSRGKSKSSAKWRAATTGGSWRVSHASSAAAHGGIGGAGSLLEQTACEQGACPSSAKAEPNQASRHAGRRRALPLPPAISEALRGNRSRAPPTPPTKRNAPLDLERGVSLFRESKTAGFFP
jgi:hypothetical protein